MKALVTVELQLCGDLFFFLSFSNCTQNEVYILFGAGFVSNDAIVEQISNDRDREYLALCVCMKYP